MQDSFSSTTTSSQVKGSPAPVNTTLTIGKVQQPAVRGVHITGSHIVPLGWPVYAGVVLHVQLLAQDNKGHQPGKLEASTQRQLTAGRWLCCLHKETAGIRAATSQARTWPQGHGWHSRWSGSHVSSLGSPKRVSSLPAVSSV